LFAGPLQRLIDELSKLPGIGPKSAQRVAFHILKVQPVEARALTEAIVEVKEKVRLCERCFNVASTELCEYCRDPRRNASIICVVQEPPDIIAIGPDELRIKELLARIHRPPDGADAVAEVIVATNPNTEGDATAMYLDRLLSPLGVGVTRLASGLPVGGDLEYADEVTLGRALDGRRRMSP
jgi:recombination protein RecR